MHLTAQHRMPQALRVALAHIVDLSQIVGLLHSLQQGLFTLLSQLPLQHRHTVKMILQGALIAAGDHQHILQPRTDRFLHHILDGGTVHHREHLFRGRLCCGQKSGAQTRRRNNSLSNRPRYISHANSIHEKRMSAEQARLKYRIFHNILIRHSPQD